MLLGSPARPGRKFISRVCAKVLIVPEGVFNVPCLCSSKGGVMWEIILNTERDVA